MYYSTICIITAVTETWSENQEGYEGLMDQIYLDLRTLENHLENRCLPPLDFTDLPYIYNTENMEPAEPEYVLNLYPPLPNLEGIDVLF